MVHSIGFVSAHTTPCMNKEFVSYMEFRVPTEVQGVYYGFAQSRSVYSVKQWREYIGLHPNSVIFTCHGSDGYNYCFSKLRNTAYTMSCGEFIEDEHSGGRAAGGTPPALIQLLHSSTSKSGYYGVYKAGSGFKAMLHGNKRVKYIGIFPTAQEAAVAVSTHRMKGALASSAVGALKYIGIDAPGDVVKRGRPRKTKE